MADPARIVCPKCGKPARDGKIQVMGVKAKLSHCNDCGLVGVVGSKADWVRKDDPDLTMKLYMMADALS